MYVEEQHTYLHAYIRTYIHTYMHIYVHTYGHTYIRTCMYTYITYLHTYIHTYRLEEAVAKGREVDDAVDRLIIQVLEGHKASMEQVGR